MQLLPGLGLGGAGFIRPLVGGVGVKREGKLLAGGSGRRWVGQLLLFSHDGLE